MGRVSLIINVQNITDPVQHLNNDTDSKALNKHFTTISLMQIHISPSVFAIKTIINLSKLMTRSVGRQEGAVHPEVDN